MAAAKTLFGLAAGAAAGDFLADGLVWRRGAAGAADGVSSAADTSPSTAIKLAAWPLPAEQALANGAEVMKRFLVQNTRVNDLIMFTEMMGDQPYASAEDVPLNVLLPAFITSELKTAFQIGFLLFLPFLVIDMVIASTLMSLGMMMLSPMLVSLPFKLLLFVLVDGWAMTVGSLVATYQVT